MSYGYGGGSAGGGNGSRRPELAPGTPDISKKIYELLGHNEISTWDLELRWSSRLEGNTLGEKTILFPRYNN